MKNLKRFRTGIIFIAVFLCAVLLVPSALEKAELSRRKKVCEEYLLQADVSLGFSVEFDILWEKEVYGADDYEIRNIYPENASEGELELLRQLVGSLEYDPDAYVNNTTEVMDGCGEDAMRIEVKCRGGGYIMLRWSFGASVCILSAYEESDNFIAHCQYKADAEVANALRAHGGLPPIPTIEEVIGRE